MIYKVGIEKVIRIDYLVDASSREEAIRRLKSCEPDYFPSFHEVEESSELLYTELYSEGE